MINRDYMMGDNGNLFESLLDISKRKFKPYPEPVQATVPEYNNPTQNQDANTQPSGGLLSALGGGDFDWRGAVSKLGAAHLALSQDPVLQKIGAGRLDEMKKLGASNQMKNRTVQELMKRGRKDLAQAVQSGLMSPTDAAKEMFRRVEGIEFQGKLVNPYTGEVISEGYGGYLDPKEQLSNLNVLRDDLRTDLGDFSQRQDAWGTINYLYQNQSGTSDLALVTAFAKILDPTSVVRGEEAKAIAGSGSWTAAQMLEIKNALDGGGTLSDEVRADIMNIAKDQYSRSLADARAKYENYSKLATAYGLDPKYLYQGDMSDPTTPEAGSMTRKAPLDPRVVALVKSTSPDATDEEIAKWWSSLSPEQKQEQLSKAGK